MKVFTLALFCSGSHLPSTKAQWWNRTPVSQVEDYSKKKKSTVTGRNQSLGESTKDVKVNFTGCLSPYMDFQWAVDIPALTLGMLGLAPAPPEIPKNSMCKNEWKYITIIRTYFKGIKV